mmetsp:Transcript_1897/g.2701  ORF Transcript_1897/g.2701 Transcript_1897/m.2701 type:complete len:503 (-) Transcript_1897:65-1573(-)
MSPLFNGDELQGITLPLRLRANTFIPGAELAVFQPDSLAHEISHIELRINNHFQPSHPTITLDRLLFVKLNGRLYEPCPEFQLKTLARTAEVLYNVDYDVAYILATRSTLFDNTISYLLPWNICHSGRDNMNLYDRIATFCTSIQRQVSRVISRECPNMAYAITFGEAAFDTVDHTWSARNVEILNQTRFNDHPMRMRIRWISHDARVRIIRSFSMYLSRAMGVPYIDPLELSIEDLDRILWCRQGSSNISPANQRRLTERIEELLPALQLSDQAARWEDGIPQRFQDHIMGLSDDDVRPQMRRLNNVSDCPPDLLFSFGLWRCSSCDTCAIGMYGRRHTGNCCGYFIRDDLMPVIYLGFCTDPDCNGNGWGLLGRSCNSCDRVMRSPTPPAWFGPDNNYKCLVRKYIAGVIVWSFPFENDLFIQDLLDACNAVRNENPNAELPQRLCFRGNPRARLLSPNYGDSISISVFGRRVMEVIQENPIVIGNISYVQADPNERVGI